ncbi:hypothetical protein [Micromonospora auratinigra]|uniref:DUF2637 domain-containing protein n=1 Tax=Micromonospora auratinigra TaxID=261654 RepID=A0A1A8Z2Q4_9ACTN|nr:hypothetical protein [Micromonospora auratinigra]SBT38091.1 hypothetical protein GA0070611_0432 [Micromonospora auratinigra]
MGVTAEQIERATEVRPVPRWVAPTFVALALLTLPWIGYLALTLPRHTVTVHYRASWVGFDLGLVALLGLTAWWAYRGDRRVVMAATGTATMLAVDAWFDVVTTPPGPELALSVALAVLVELPLAGVCLWIARHGDQMVERRLRRLAVRAQLAADRADSAQRTAASARRRLARVRGRLR